MNRPTRWEQSNQSALNCGYQGDEAKKVAKHIFAKQVTGGATIGKKKGKLVVHKECYRPRLP